MAVSTNYHNGTPCYAISGVTAYELPKCETSEPRYIRNTGPDILVVSPASGQTIDSGASISLSPDDCMLINPIGTDWVLIMQPTDTLAVSQIGYAVGTGGSVTQASSVNTAKLNSQIDEVENGSCNITIADLHNQSTGVITVVVNYAVIKGDS